MTERAPAQQRGTSLIQLYVLVFVVGAASLGAEIATVRLLAPYFGASSIVWANTIGIVLIALSVGYWLGGRIADKHPYARDLYRVVLFAAVLLAIVPFVARPILDVGVDALESISAGAFIGSMIGTLLLIAFPVALLGTVAPWVIRLGIDRVEDAGALAGRLYAISTVGSLFGTVFSSLVLVPALGTRRTFLLFAFSLALVALIGLRHERSWRRAAAVPAVMVVLMVIPAGAIKPTSADGKVIYETETPYQYARVVEQPDGSRLLELNEGQAVHSLYRPTTALTGNYWDGHIVLPFAAMDRAPARVAILGNAAGTTARAYGRYFPHTNVDAVEIDAELTRIGRQYMGLSNPRMRAFHEDARPYLERTKERYDVISLDAYRQPYIPFYLTTREFFELARDRLTPGGAVVVNVGHPKGQQDLEKVLTATLREVFPNVMRDPREATNTLLIASESKISAERLRKNAAMLPADLQPIAETDAALLVPGLIGGDVYTDDKAPVEWLIDKSIVSYSAEK